MPHRILFLCTGNSCRSQMAEGYAKALGGEEIEAESAGIEAHGLNTRAVRIMADDGVDISGQASQVVSDGQIRRADWVVTGCGHADEHCPMLPAGTRHRHWPLDDPARATGTEAEIDEAFRACRDTIREQVRRLLTEIEGTGDG